MVELLLHSRGAGVWRACMKRESLDSMRARCLGARPPPMNSPRYLARRHGVHIAANLRRRVASNVWGFKVLHQILVNTKMYDREVLEYPAIPGEPRIQNKRLWMGHAQTDGGNKVALSTVIERLAWHCGVALRSCNRRHAADPFTSQRLLFSVALSWSVALGMGQAFG